MHNLCCDNCHSHVARALNIMQYDGSTRSSKQHKNIYTNINMQCEDSIIFNIISLSFSQTKTKNNSSHFLQLEHGDPVRADACAREARELVR